MSKMYGYFEECLKNNCTFAVIEIGTKKVLFCAKKQL
jgi:hypothetical protein